MSRPHPTLTAYYPSEAERSGFVRRLFDDTAADYDRLNALLSFGSGRGYRRRALRDAGLTPGAAVLDVATGTGLVAAEARRLLGATGSVIALDVSWEMLRRARGIVGLALVQGSADHLPLRDGQFDLLTMGYALRHVASLAGAFAEFHRVLRPGGRLLLLEVGRPDGRVPRALVRLYLGRLAPWLSRAAGRSARAEVLMRYYWETIDSCVSPGAIVAALREAGFAAAACTTELGLFRAYTAARPRDA